MPKTKQPRRPRKRYVYMSLLNVKAHPHEAGASVYTKLWKAAVDQEVSAGFHGDKIARIASANDDLISGRPALVGEIWTYTRVGGKGGVMNVRERRILNAAEFKRIDFDWEAHGFNPRVFQYAFLPDLHRVGFEWRGGLSPRFLKWLLQTILNAPDVLLATNATHVDVEVEQDDSKLEEIFALKLDRLTVFLTKPNPDDLAGLEEAFRKSMADQHAESQELVIRSEPGSALRPSKQTKDLARLALSNGHVSGHGRDVESRRVKTLDTIEKPVRKGETWDPSDETFPQYLVRRTAEFVTSRIKRRRE